jgi:hypothetical protein
MIRIDLFNDFGIFDTSNAIQCKTVFQKYPDLSDNEITISFLDCFLDYHKAHSIPDHFLGLLSKRLGSKKLIIEYDFPYDPTEYARWFFYGSKFYDIPINYKDVNGSAAKKAISKLEKSKISLIINIIDNEKKIKSYEFPTSD